MSKGQRVDASVQKNKSEMPGYSAFAESFEIFWAFGVGFGDVAIRHIDDHDQPAGAKFSDRYAHWLGDS